jgi:hypothetical protein
MRTTITLEDDAFEVVQTYAKANALRLGQAVSQLVLRAASAGNVANQAKLVQKGDFWVIEPPAGTHTHTHTHTLTMEQVNALKDGD